MKLTFLWGALVVWMVSCGGEDAKSGTAEAQTGGPPVNAPVDFDEDEGLIAGAEAQGSTAGAAGAASTEDVSETIIPSESLALLDVPASGWPGPRFNRRIGAASGYYCILLPSRKIRCSGQGAPRPPLGEFQQIAVGYPGVCGIRRDGTLACSELSVFDEVPEGVFASIVMGEKTACALDAVGMAQCWGDVEGRPEAFTVPPVPFRQLTLASKGGCGVTLDGEPLCWGEHSFGSGVVDHADYLALYSGYYNCGLLGDGEVGCIARTIGQTIDTPAHPTGKGFVLLDTNGLHVCALHASGALRCAGIGIDNWAESDTNVPQPEARFVEIATLSDGMCGVIDTNQLRCWGEDPPKETHQDEPIFVISLEGAADTEPCDDDAAYMAVMAASTASTASIQGAIADDPLMPSCLGWEDGRSVFKMQGHIHGHAVDRSVMSGSQFTGAWFKSNGLEMRSAAAAIGQAVAIDTGSLLLPEGEPLGGTSFIITEAEMLDTPLEEGRTISWRITGIRQDKGIEPSCPTPELPVVLRGCQYRGE